MRSHAMESSPPRLESAVVGIDVLHVINLGNHPDTRRPIDLKTNFPVKTPPFREEPGWGGVFAAPSQPLSER